MVVVAAVDIGALRHQLPQSLGVAVGRGRAEATHLIRGRARVRVRVKVEWRVVSGEWRG